MGFLRAMFDRRSAAAQRALDERRLDDAETLLLEITRGRSAAADDWWNLGLVYKFQKRWPEALEAFVRNSESKPAPEAFWNSALAATALRNWTVARWAWNRLSFDVGPGDGPPDANFGPSPVRLNPDGHGEGSNEVVWGRRVDPCRIRILSVPLPASGHRFGDVVLHDVVPRGSRMLQGVELAVFDELDRMDPSPYPTMQGELTWASPDDERDLDERFGRSAVGAENWTSSVTMLCASCSLSNAHEHTRDEEVRLTGTWGFGGDGDVVRSILNEWASVSSSRTVSALETPGVP